MKSLIKRATTLISSCKSFYQCCKNKTDIEKSLPLLLILDKKTSFFYYIQNKNDLWYETNETYYQRNREIILNRAKDYYENSKEALMEQARKTCGGSTEQEKK